MTDQSEADFVDDVVIPYLALTHPDADLEREHYIDDPPAYCDVWVDLGSHVLACEVGNDASVRDEAAQAVEYAHAVDRAVPVVIIPSDHAGDPSIDIWGDERVLVWELDAGDIPQGGDRV